MQLIENKAADQSGLRQHIEMLHGVASGTDGVLVVSVFHSSSTSDTDRPGVVTHHSVGDVAGMIDAIAAHSCTPGANVYVGLQVMRKGLKRGHRGGEADIVAVLGLVADMDADTGKVGELPHDPSFVLETSPGNRQPFWIFDKPLSPAVAKPIAAALRRATGADFGTSDISHVWRIPGTLNWPNAKKLARGRDADPAPVTVLEPWDGTFIDPTAFAVAVGAAAGARPEAAKMVVVDLQHPDVDGIDVSDAAKDLLQADGQPDRSAHAARVIEKLAFDRHSPGEAFALIKACEGKWKDRYTTDARLEADFVRMWSKFERQDDTPLVDTSRLVAVKRSAPDAANDNLPDPVDIWAEARSPSLPTDILPGAIEDFARARAEQMGVDPGGLAMACLTVCAAAIPDNLTLKIKRHENWKESARIWTMIVGDPSARKSPIIKVASSPLMKLESGLQLDHRVAMRDWLSLGKDKKGKPEPIAKRVATEDSSPEKVGEILSNNENGLALIDDELSGWFSRMEKYAGSKGSGADRAFWLKSFGGGSYSIDRIGRGSIWVPNISITLLGGIQPDPLKKIAKDLTDDGLLQRMFCIMLSPAGNDRDEPSAVGENVYANLVERLFDLRARYMAGRGFRFCDAAQDLRSELAGIHHQMELNWSRINKRVATHIGKFDGLFGRLALLFHVVDHIYDGELPHEVSLDTATKAKSLLHDYLLQHTIALHFNVLGVTDMQDVLVSAAGSILTNDRLSDVVSVSSLRKWSTRQVRELDNWQMERVLQKLDGFSWLEPKQLERNETSARYTVNPRVHAKFADRALLVSAERRAIRDEIQRYAG